eukprot:TRINITY_DN2542_c0_g1_i1.p4 TRINITY_DN2542_c0_g1~~TRINITY_DN2542_c0_g1_i1.p4  ORF type:complete len:192 (+),score=7.34 TRINITY_DN2542_c0_g1_i1:1530-2105(+)
MHTYIPEPHTTEYAVSSTVYAPFLQQHSNDPRARTQGTKKRKLSTRISNKRNNLKNVREQCRIIHIGKEITNKKGTCEQANKLAIIFIVQQVPFQQKSNILFVNIHIYAFTTTAIVLFLVYINNTIECLSIVVVARHLSPVHQPYPPYKTSSPNSVNKHSGFIVINMFNDTIEHNLNQTHVKGSFPIATEF